jgi:hypothetical protein
VGNWRTVNITGTMTAADAAKLRKVLDWGDYSGGLARYRDMPAGADCLSFSSVSPGLCGLGAWPAEQVNRCGNLHERDYSVRDVAEALEALVHIAPSMLLKVHCGGEYEAGECVAAISVGEGLVVIGKPERATVDGPGEDQMLANLARNMMR